MKVTITDQALMQIAELPRVARLRVLNVTERLANWPQVSGVKWLTGDWKGHARIRTGDYRVIFRLQGRHEIVVVRFADRRDAYAD
jgi:mRNA-degrading endonuclease RelE of RelBE toxin-antitoxin system